MMLVMATASVMIAIESVTDYAKANQNNQKQIKKLKTNNKQK